MTFFSKYQKSVSDLCLTHNVKKLYAFGSVINGELKPESDIDLIVDFLPATKNYAHNYFDLKFSLEQLFNRDVDLLEEKALKNPYFLDNINQNKVQIYG